MCLYIVCLFSSCLNSMLHVFSYLQVLVSPLFYVEFMKDVNPGKYCSTSSTVRSLFVMLCISFEGQRYALDLFCIISIIKLICVKHLLIIISANENVNITHNTINRYKILMMLIMQKRSNV